MLTCSEQFKAKALTAPALAVKVEYQLAGETAWASLLAPSVRELLDGSVTITGESLVRRTASISLGGEDALFTSWSHPCSPLNRFRLYIGMVLRPGVIEYLRLGTFIVTGYSRDRRLKHLDLDLADFMDALNGDQLPIPVETTEDELVLPYIKRLINTTATDLPGYMPDTIEPAFPGATLTVLPGVDEGATLTGEAPVFTESRGDAVDYLARVMNAEVWADVDGNFVIGPRLVDSTTVTPVFTFTAGDGGNYSDLSDTGSLDDFANAVSITNGDYVVQTSITSGPLAVRPGLTRRYVEDVSSQAWDEEATDRYARRVIAERLGLAERVRATTLPVWWLDAQDVVDVAKPDSIVETHRIDTYTLPLGLGRSELATRTVRLSSSVTSGRTIPDVFTPIGTGPVLEYVTGGDDSFAVSAVAGLTAVLVCRGDVTAVSGGWDVWDKVVNGGDGLHTGAGEDTLDVWVGTGVGSGLTVALIGGSTGGAFLAAYSAVRGELYAAVYATLGALDATDLAAPLVPAEPGDIVVTAARGEGGYRPASVTGAVVETGFTGARAGQLDGTTQGVAGSTGLAVGDLVGGEWTMAGSGYGQALNLVLRPGPGVSPSFSTRLAVGVNDTVWERSTTSSADTIVTSTRLDGTRVFLATAGDHAPNSAGSTFARYRAKLPESYGIAPQGWFSMSAKVNLLTSADHYYSFLRTDNYVGKFKGTTTEVGCASGDEWRVGTAMQPGDEIQLISTHQNNSTLVLWSGTLLPGEHDIKFTIDPKADESGSWSITIDGVTASGTGQTIPSTVPLAERVVTRAVTCIDGANLWTDAAVQVEIEEAVFEALL